MALKPFLTKGQVVLIFIFILLPLFGVTGCIAAFKLFTDKSGLYDRWVNLGSPPAKIERLLAADTATIYVKTTDDRLFFCYRESYYDQDCWNELGLLPHLWEDEPDCPPLDNMPSEPNGVVERLNNRHCIASPVYEGNHWFSYVLLDDGTVMQWISKPIWFAPNVAIRFIQKLFGGTLIGALTGIVVSVFLYRFGTISETRDQAR